MLRKRPSWKEWVVLFAILSIIVPWILLAMHLQALRHASARQTMCLNRLNQIGKAMEIYRYAWDDRLPALSTTRQRAPEGKARPDLLMPYIGQMDPRADSEALAQSFRCADSTHDRLTYSLSRRIAGLKSDRIKSPSTTIAAFDSVNDSPLNNNLNGDSVWRPSDGGVPGVGCLVIWPYKRRSFGLTLPKWASPRHGSNTMVLWVDGHVTAMSLMDPPDSPQHAPRFDPGKPKDE
jgi:prepilin-type processing-associated H-X9-DG protein